MFGTALLFGFLVVATYTDLRWRKIYNWTTYPAILLALFFNGLASLASVVSQGDVPSSLPDSFGFVGFSDSLLGFLACSTIMVICFVFFVGGVGGGDIKLVAMTGAFLGVYRGLEAMLWTFTLAGALALIWLVWSVGAWRIISRSTKYVLYWTRLGMFAPLTDEDRRPLKTKLFLAPSALVSVLIIQFHFVEGLW